MHAQRLPLALPGLLARLFAAGRSDAGVFRRLAEGRVQLARLPVTPYRQRSGRTGRHRGHQPRQVAQFLHLAAVERQDDIALFEACLRAGAAGSHHRNERTVFAVQAQACGDCRRHLLDLYAEPTAAYLAVRLELGDDRLGDVRGYRKADPDTAAVRRIDRGVDADHLAVKVEGRPAGIAAVDRRVDLQEIVELAGMDVAAARRDDPGGDAAAEAKRIADGDHPVADLRRAARSEADRG